MATTKETGTGERLERVRALLGEERLGALLVRGTDRYLNEYVPAAESLRIWLTGFTGSVGDALVTPEQAFVFVDGRYYLQAERECDPSRIQVVRVPFGVTIEEAVLTRLEELGRKHGPGLVVGFEPEKVSVELLDKLKQALERAGATWKTPRENLVAKARGETAPPAAGRLEAVPEPVTGEGSAAKLARVREKLAEAEADGVLVTRLDEVAWLTNLRAYEIDYSATFRSLAYVGRDLAILFVDPAKLTDEARAALGPDFVLAAESDWEDTLKRALGAGRQRVEIDPAGTTMAVKAALERVLGGGQVVATASPVQALKARKNPRELATMTDSFRRADAVVEAAVKWLNAAVAKGRRVSERDFADRVEGLFREAGARALSFRVISAAGANGAVIHYSHPDPDRRIRKGELMLLDTGAYFAAGYATDLTRTFLAGGGAATANSRQKLIYTLVLKASIRGMKARFPAGTTGVQLDAIVRAPIWEAGYDYLHGTGHGVGVLVHEFPPRVSTRSSSPLESGMVFSIEPGIYLPGWGGVRIENLVTVIEDPKVEGFLRVRPLTFAALERRLIEPRLLSADEKDWLRQYRRGRA